MSNLDRSALDSLIFEVFRLHGALAAAGDELTEPLGLTSARWQVLGSIDSNGEATVAELGRRIGLTRQSVQRVVNDLVSEKHIKLIENPRDKRAKQVVLTPRGKRSHRAIDSLWRPIASRMAKQFGQDSLAEAARLLGELRNEFLGPAFKSGISGKRVFSEGTVNTIRIKRKKIK